jgi:shikimate kinase/3-dehydroquinate synthase
VSSLEELEPEALDDIVFECARFKAAVVAEDERDSGRRQILNLGHTVGHAIESAGRYEVYRHGEAVGLGLLAALRLSETAELRSEVECILGSHGLPVALDGRIEIEAVMAAVGRDKKSTSQGGPGFVLLPEPGAPEFGAPIDADRVRAAVEELVA